MNIETLSVGGMTCAAMSLSSVSVLTNTLRLKRFMA
jgi:cation transport ATPase